MAHQITIHDDGRIVVETETETTHEVRELSTRAAGIVRRNVEKVLKQRETFAGIHIDGEGFRTVEVYRLFARKAIRDIRAWRAAYDAEVAEWYENGEGAAPRWEWITCPTCGGTGGHSESYGGGEGLMTRFERCGNPHCQEGQLYVNQGGQGHTFPHCIHGSSRWTDYDNICGGCEDDSTDLQIASLRAREQFLRFNARWEWVNAAPGDLDHDTRRELLQWATDLFPKEK